MDVCAEDKIKLPIKVVVNKMVKEPMLVLNEEHYSRLVEIASRIEYS